MLVDWVFEIVCVFEKSTQIVFMAMGYVDQYFSITKVSKIRVGRIYFLVGMHFLP